jgi:hypothetical protein
MKHSIIGGDLNLPQVDWKRVAEGISVTQALVERLLWDYAGSWKTNVRGSLLHVYLVRPESALIPCPLRYGTRDL